MEHQPTPQADPIANLVQAILDDGEYAYSDLYSREEWVEAAHFYNDDGLNAEQHLADKAALDKAFAGYPAGDLWKDGPDVDDWLTDNVRPAESYVPAGAAV